MQMNYYVCEHDLTHKSERHECDGCCSQVILIDKNIQTIMNKSYQDGINDGQSVVLQMLEGHLSVCNYWNVTGEECDICHWAESMIDEIFEVNGKLK